MKALPILWLTLGVLSFPVDSWAQSTGTGNNSSSADALNKTSSDPAAPTPLPLTGDYQFTLNGSIIGRVLPSMGHRLQLAAAPRFGGSFNLRIEYYTEGSFNEDPPGQLLSNINEHKFELQLMYNRPLLEGFGFTVGALQHENFTFPDHYYWYIAGLTWSRDVSKNLTLSAAVLGEKRSGANVRPFYDFSAGAEWRFAREWAAQASFHRYENLGASDLEPTQKEEIELGLQKDLPYNQYVGVSFFRHIQFDAPNDQFSFLKLKWGVRF